MRENKKEKKPKFGDGGEATKDNKMLQGRMGDRGRRRRGRRRRDTRRRET